MKILRMVSVAASVPVLVLIPFGNIRAQQIKAGSIVATAISGRFV